MPWGSPGIKHSETTLLVLTLMGVNIIESVMEFELIIISKINKYVLNYFVEEKVE